MSAIFSCLMALALIFKSTSLPINFLEHNVKVSYGLIFSPILVLFLFLFRNKIKNKKLLKIVIKSFFIKVIFIFSLLVACCLVLAFLNFFIGQFNHAGAALLMGIFWYVLLSVTKSNFNDMQSRNLA